MQFASTTSASEKPHQKPLSGADRSHRFVSLPVHGITPRHSLVFFVGGPVNIPHVMSGSDGLAAGRRANFFTSADDIRHVRGSDSLRQSRCEAATKAFQRCLRDSRVAKGPTFQRSKMPLQRTAFAMSEDRTRFANRVCEAATKAFRRRRSYSGNRPPLSLATLIRFPRVTVSPRRLLSRQSRNVLARDPTLAEAATKGFQRCRSEWARVVARTLS
jgi:hypothetical protein